MVRSHPSGLFLRGDPSRLNGIARKTRSRPNEKGGGRRARVVITPDESIGDDDFEYQEEETAPIRLEPVQVQPPRQLPPVRIEEPLHQHLPDWAPYNRTPQPYYNDRSLQHHDGNVAHPLMYPSRLLPPQENQPEFRPFHQVNTWPEVHARKMERSSSDSSLSAGMEGDHNRIYEPVVAPPQLRFKAGAGSVNSDPGLRRMDRVVESQGNNQNNGNGLQQQNQQFRSLYPTSSPYTSYPTYAHTSVNDSHQQPVSAFDSPYYEPYVPRQLHHFNGEKQYRTSSPPHHENHDSVSPVDQQRFVQHTPAQRNNNLHHLLDSNEQHRIRYSPPPTFESQPLPPAPTWLRNHQEAHQNTLHPIQSFNDYN